MKWLIAISTVLLLILPIMAHEESIVHPHIRTLGVLGKGIAVSTVDPKDFSLLKIGVAKVVVNLAGEEVDVTIGILFLDNNKYKLTNIVTSESNVTADVYSNDTKVGSLQANLVMKGDAEIWVGTLSINDKNYNIYVLEATRKVKPLEVGEKVKDVCDEFPNKCRVLARGIGNRFCEKVEDKSCREKIKEFCEENPEDPRCVSVFRDFCAEHLDDSRCRDELRDFCSANPEEDRCERFCRKFPDRCEVKTTTIECEKSECGPQLGMPNYLCSDGKTTAGPTGRCLRHADGKCGWEVINCPTTTTVSTTTTSTTTSTTSTTTSTTTTTLPQNTTTTTIGE